MEIQKRHQIYFDQEIKLEVAIEYAKDPTDPALISIRHTEIPAAMPGEVLLAPGDIPEILKALSQASIQIYRREGYNTSLTEGIQHA